MCFDKTAVPSGPGSAGWQIFGGVSRHAVAQIHVVLPVHVEGFDVQILDEPPAVCAYAREAPVAFRLERRSPAGEVVSRRLTNVAVGSNPLDPKPLPRSLD